MSTTGVASSLRLAVPLCALLAGCTVARSVGELHGQADAAPAPPDGDGDADAGERDAAVPDAVDLQLPLQKRTVSASIKSSCALSKGTPAKVYCWGENAHGTVGHPPTAADEWVGDARAVGLGSFVPASLFGGPTIACALDAQGRAMCWGRSSFFSRTGNFEQSITSPAPVASLGEGQAALAIGADYLCALHSTGRVRCVGINAAGQLGTGSRADEPTPRDVTGLPPVMGIAASMGGSFTFARTVAGELYAWGDGSSGVFDDATRGTTLAPHKLEGLAGVRDMALGLAHVCVLDEQGGVHCWGQGSKGELGVSGSSTFTQRAKVSLPAPATAITAGYQHTCALLQDTRVFCWGSNGQMQAQLNGPTTSVGPVEGYAKSAATSISASLAHTCAWGAADVFCWGGVVTGTYDLR